MITDCSDIVILRHTTIEKVAGTHTKIIQGRKKYSLQTYV